MAEINNISEINENFNTIKTLLNSIRAQGILNTSDVDKLLSGINNKLDKINTDTDIDIVKSTLKDLQEALDERHGVLISKFGAIESVFTNLLKTNSEMLTGSEIKELFDIIATNLSVFSREVVSQKEFLTDISLRLEAIRSDDSQKKEIVKNIALLKSDVDRIGNGFDSIVLSLNDNFKAVINTIAGFDKTDYLDKFQDKLQNVEMASETVLSAIQLLDKKTAQIENIISEFTTKEDLKNTNSRIVELVSQGEELNSSVQDLVSKYSRIDNLSEKIDASVNIIASLKTVLEDSDNKNAAEIIGQLKEIENGISMLSVDEKYADLKLSLNNLIQNSQTISSEGFAELLSDLSSKAEILDKQINNSRVAISDLCESKYSTLISDIKDLKFTISQIEEGTVSSNNAIFSNITDRLTIFENSLKVAIETQDKTLSESSGELTEKIDAIKNVTSVLDYKMDSSVVEVNGLKSDFSTLKTAVESMLALDFVNTVKDLRVDLYATKQDVVNTFDVVNNDLTDKFSQDVYAKYDSLLTKLNMVEKDIKETQSESLLSVKKTLDNVSSLLVDVMSYVSEPKEFTAPENDKNFEKISNSIKENNLFYLENLRELLDTLKVQILNNIEKISNYNKSYYDDLKNTVILSDESVKHEISSSYDKLLEIQNNVSEVKDEALKLQDVQKEVQESVLNNIEDSKTDIKNSIIVSTENIKDEIVIKLDNSANEIASSQNSNITKSSEEIKAAIENSENSINQNLLNKADAVVSDVSDKVITSLSNNAAATKQELLNKADAVVSDVSDKVITSLSNNAAATKQELLNKADAVVSDVSDKVINSLSNNAAAAKQELLDKADSIVSDISSKVINSGSNNANEIKQDIVQNRTLINSVADSIANNISNKTDEIKQYTNDSLNSIKNALFDDTKQIIEGQTDKINLNISGNSENEIKQISENTENSIKRNSDKAINEIDLKINNAASTVVENIGDSITANVVALEAKIADNANSVQMLKESVTGAVQQEAANLANKISESSKEFNNLLGEDLKSKIAENTNEAIQKIGQNINVAQDNTTANIKNALADVSGNIQEKIEQSSSSVANLFLSDMRKELEEYSTKLQALEEFYREIKEEINTNNVNYSDKYDKIAESATGIRDDFEIKLNNFKSNLLEKITSFKDDFADVKATLEKVDENVDGDMQRQFSLINGNFESLVSQISIMFDKSNLSVSDVISEEFGSISENVTVMLTEKLENYKSTIEKTFGNIDAKSNEQAEYIKETITKLDENMRDVWDAQVQENVSKLENVTDSIKYIIDENVKTNSVSFAEFKEKLDGFTDDMSKQAEAIRLNISDTKDFLNEAFAKGLSAISSDVEKETDTIIAELTEQLDILKRTQQDDIVNITSKIEEVVNAGLYSNIEDLKSQIKQTNNNSELIEKLDNLQSEVSNVLGNLISDLNRMLDAESFSSAMSDFRLANEILINSAVDRMNDKFQTFICNNMQEITNSLQASEKTINDKFALFDKKFVEVLTDKYEELKLISANNNNSFNDIESAINKVFVTFEEAKSDISGQIEGLVNVITSNTNATNNEIKTLCDSFENLKSQISNRSLDEAFQTALNKQIKGIEDLVLQQYDYIQDINELCSNNLPDVSEMNTILKYSILTSINDFSEKLDNQDIEGNISKALTTLKTDIITQFLNIFNQISFVAEEEEIIDYIQDKHSELIKILGTIVDSTDKIVDLKEEIKLINNKINSIISSENEDVDYVYSLQDLETDIANLRLVLNEMSKKNNDEEIANLIKSTDEICKLLNTIKQEMPSKSDLSSMAEDIESISTRTNKLILASDESYKTLQDNLQDFKLVINDLDERTRNFPQEAGIDKINSKLETINDMVASGAKTNQVFNQVFEYLAEWVDNAGTQIETISDRVETLGEIGQIKDILIDLKHGSENNASSDELIGALESVFTKQTKRISSIESKLDRIIVETTLNNKVDITPMENTLNKFLAIINEKMSEQQAKINSLEKELLSLTKVKTPSKKTTTETKSKSKVGKK